MKTLLLIGLGAGLGAGIAIDVGYIATAKSLAMLCKWRYLYSIYKECANLI